MNIENMRKTLVDHSKWLKGDGGARADLSGADLREADLRGSDLRWADLRGADLSMSDLSEADLRGSDLSGANLSEAGLRVADLIMSDLSGADLSGADLSGADLCGATLRGSDLSGANLRGSDFDFSSGIPLWCGGMAFTCDMRLIRQVLAHLCTLECDDPEWVTLRASLLPHACKSHRASDLHIVKGMSK